MDPGQIPAKSPGSQPSVCPPAYYSGFLFPRFISDLTPEAQPHLDAHNTTFGFDNLGEGTPIICLLIESLMEEDDTPNAGIHTVIGSEQQLAVEAPVLLGVLGANGLQPLGNAPWKGAAHGLKGISLLPPTLGPPPTVSCPYQWTHLQPGCPCPEPQCAERCQTAPSFAPESVLGIGRAWCQSVSGQRRQGEH